MSWQDRYLQKRKTAREAVALIPSGSRVIIAHAAGEPVTLTDALCANHAAYENVEIIHMVAMGKALYCAPGMERHFRHNSLFLGAATREAIAQGRGDFTPCYFHEVPQLFQTNLRPDAVLFQVSPPDADGYCSFGISVDYTKPAVECAMLRIAQVNAHMPRTVGDTLIHVDELTCVVEADEPLIELAPSVVGEVERQIGAHCAALVQDGDTLQLGIGAIPDAMLQFLHEKNDIGVHSEMLSDGVAERMRAGNINNTRKTLLKGKSVATFLMGTKSLYEFAHENADIALYPVTFVNDPNVIARNDHLVAINSCVQVDLLGQVASTSVGLRQISGVGGQVDFVRGAAMSKGGRSIMAMPSLSKGGVSKIVPVLDAGAAVSTNRYDVQYVVTEFGAALLKGKTLRERARLLIGIAHPSARPALQEAYASRFLEPYSGE